MTWLLPLLLFYLSVIAASEEVDVIVVGGGLAGLAAAHEFASLRPDQTVVVLEAKKQLGGRIQAVDMFTINGTEKIDIGAQWIAPSHSDLIQLVRTLGLTLESQTSCGERKLYVEEEEEHQRVARSALDAALPYDQILQAAQIQKFAGQSVQEWIHSANLTSNEMNIVHRILQTVVDAPESSISALHLLLLSSSESAPLGEVLAGLGHGQGMRVQEGLAEMISKFSTGVDARLDEPVLSVIREDNGTVTVRSSKKEYTAKQVIIAVPPSIASSIHFVPALPHNIHNFLQSYAPVGHAYHFAVTYNHPWWRANNISGEGVFGSRAGPLTWMTTFDTGKSSECGSCGSSSGVLYGMAHFASHVPFGNRKELISKGLLKTMTYADAEEDIIDYKDYQYSHDEYLGGTVGVLPPSSDLSYLLLINDTISHGPIHFASAELSRVSMGLMNGALLSGKQAAHVVDAVIDTVPSEEEESEQATAGRNPLYDSVQTPSLSDLLLPSSSPSPSPSAGVTSFSQESTVSSEQPEVEESIDGPRVESSLRDQPVKSTTPFIYTTSTFYPPTTPPHEMESTAAFAWGPGDFEYTTSTQYPAGVAVGGAAARKPPAAAAAEEFQHDAAAAAETKDEQVEIAESHDSSPQVEKDEELRPFVEPGFEYKHNHSEPFDYHTSTQYPPTAATVPSVDTVTHPAAGGFEYSTSTHYPPAAAASNVSSMVDQEDEEDQEGPAKMAVLKNEQMVPLIPEDISGEIRTTSGAAFDYHTSTQYPPTQDKPVVPLVHFSAGNMPPEKNPEAHEAFSVDEPSRAEEKTEGILRDQVEGSGEGVSRGGGETVDHVARAQSAMQTLEAEVPLLPKEESASIGDRLLALLHKILALLKGE